jgi:two-component system cell cycle sensor histidine kinase PleC
MRSLPQTLNDLIIDADPVSPTASVAAVKAQFSAASTLVVLAVVDADGVPVGLLSRSAALAAADDAGVASDIMRPAPLLVAPDDSAATVNRRIVAERPDSLGDGVVVVEAGRYAGVVPAARLLQLTVAETDARAVELEKARHEAEQASRAKSQFLANMSHELRTPLNAIIGFSEIIRDQTFGPVGSPQYRDYARDIHQSGQHLLDLVNDILDLSKVEAGAIELHEEMIDVADLIDSSLMLVRQPALRGEVNLVVELPDVLPSLTADPRQIKQVLVNLLSNAVKFTPAGGEVRVTASTEDGMAIVVADSGIGIAAEDIPLAMAPFRRIDGEINRKLQGTGLGLPLSKALVEAHGGRLHLASTPGAGTKVTATLPSWRLDWSKTRRETA